MTDTNKNVRQAQTDLFLRLETFELVLSELYKAYASLFPDMHDLWHNMAKEEEQHAKWVQIMIGLLEDGYHFYNLDSIKVSMLNEKIGMIEKQREEAQRGNVTQKDAIITALSLEASIIEAEIYQNIKSDAPTLPYITEQLVRETQKHNDQINLALKHLK